MHNRHTDILILDSNDFAIIVINTVMKPLDWRAAVIACAAAEIYQL